MPDVLFVVLDSLRKDHVSTYGYDRQTTPALDTLAERATVYENAYVPAPWTLPSHCSMFTGLYPSEHGITNGFTDSSLSLPAEHETIAETFSEDGYRTAGYSNNPWVGQLSDLNRGFDRFVEWDLEVSSGEPDRTRDLAYDRCHSLLGRAIQQPLVLVKRRFFTENLVSRAQSWIRENERAPTFTFLNLMEAHSPYYPPDSGFERLGLQPPNAVSKRVLNTKLLAYVMGQRELDGREQQRVHEFYDASIRYQDGQLERLLATLREQGTLDETLLVICADHGKTLGEFDRNETPPHYLRNINVNVPLVVKWPGQTEGKRVTDPVELTNLHAAMETMDEDALTTETGYALTEDFLPHTASESTSITRWRSLNATDLALARCEDGREYVLDGNGETETAQRASAVDTDRLRTLQTRLSKREKAVDARAATTDRSEDDEEIASGLESQLQDLGYLS
ncbi:sulfatase [Halorientalis brevis]|uniref:Sulfatase n=1 Tax=Halorientalis brevis TaxID=1126241 RepID=A0ABD6CFF8_9EURY|nr:sulfatase [Halorientalis brevis]